MRSGPAAANWPFVRHLDRHPPLTASPHRGCKSVCVCVCDWLMPSICTGARAMLCARVCMLCVRAFSHRQPTFSR